MHGENRQPEGRGSQGSAATATGEARHPHSLKRIGAKHPIKPQTSGTMCGVSYLLGGAMHRENRQPEG